MFLNVEMGTCNGCPDYSRRIEVYSNKDTGCGTEFYIDSSNDNGDGDNGGDDNEGGDSSGGGGDSTSPGASDAGTVPPIEEGASKIISAAFAAVSMMALY